MTTAPTSSSCVVLLTRVWSSRHGVAMWAERRGATRGKAGARTRMGLGRREEEEQRQEEEEQGARRAGAVWLRVGHWRESVTAATTVICEALGGGAGR
ncbi:hypothetical protein ZWY2020_005062 [Hordeum vulgare]|nr:hypothetical protein ZWY2020_005062 [Hordeum vulgare]